MSEPSESQLMFVSSGDIFGIAKSAYRRMIAPEDERVTEDDYSAVVAIIFSVMAMEAFINELFCASKVTSRGRLSDEVRRLKSFAIARDFERNTRLDLKFNLAHLALNGMTYDSSEQPFQDFTLLIELRNAVTHMRPEDKVTLDADGNITVNYRRIVEKLRSKNILAEEPNKNIMLRINTPAAACWACTTASTMVKSILEPLSYDFIGLELQTNYQYWFAFPNDLPQAPLSYSSAEQPQESDRHE